jgi:hypothetical protein
VRPNGRPKTGKPAIARKLQGWPKSCKLAQDFDCKSRTASSWPNFWANPVTFTLIRPFVGTLEHFDHLILENALFWGNGTSYDCPGGSAPRPRSATMTRAISRPLRRLLSRRLTSAVSLRARLARRRLLPAPGSGPDIGARAGPQRRRLGQPQLRPQGRVEQHHADRKEPSSRFGPQRLFLGPRIYVVFKIPMENSPGAQF